MHKSAHLYSNRQHIFQSVKTLIAKESTAEMVHGDWKLNHLNWLNAFSVKLRSKCHFVWFICSHNEINSVSAQSENKKQMFHDSKLCTFFTVWMMYIRIALHRNAMLVEQLKCNCKNAATLFFLSLVKCWHFQASSRNTCAQSLCRYSSRF